MWADKTNEMAQNIVVGLYPTELADDASVDVLGATDAWLDAHPDAAARRCAGWSLESRDGVRRALAAQQADLRRA